MPFSRRMLLNAAAAGTAMALAPRLGRAAYPERPIRLIVPFPAGGAVDAVGRLLANAIGPDLAQPIVIEDRGGAGGIVGMEAAAHATPDGYTMMVSHSGFAAMPGLYRKLPFDPVQDFAGVITATSGIYVLVVNPSLPFKSVADLIAYARANPGKLAYASAGIGSTLRLASEFVTNSEQNQIPHPLGRNSVRPFPLGDPGLKITEIGRAGRHAHALRDSDHTDQPRSPQSLFRAL